VGALQPAGFVREHVSEIVELRSGVGALEDHVRRAEARGEDIKISPPMGADIVRFMNQKVGPGQQIMDLYWGCPPPPCRAYSTAFALPPWRS
jgi:hypothetical protein